MGDSGVDSARVSRPERVEWIMDDGDMGTFGGDQMHRTSNHQKCVAYVHKDELTPTPSFSKVQLVELSQQVQVLECR